MFMQILQVLDKHEDELIFVFGNAILGGYKMGTYVDMVTLLPSPYALQGNSTFLMQVSPFHCNSAQRVLS